MGDSTATRTAATDVLDDVVREIVEDVRAELVVLFGSRAWGTPHEYCDYDLMLVLGDGVPIEPVRKAAYTVARGHGLSVDILAQSATEYTRHQHDPGLLSYMVAREGRVLFTTGAIPQRSGAHGADAHGNGVLSFEAPKADDPPFSQFISDPAHPVPYRPRPIEETYDPRGSRWRTWETQDQRFVDGRPDVVSWSSAPLTEDVTIAGTAHAKHTARFHRRSAPAELHVPEGLVPPRVGLPARYITPRGVTPFGVTPKGVGITAR